jgi:glycosyltransferase involved in cell wall biosynthesis
MPDDQITSDFEPEAPKSPRVAVIASRLTVSEFFPYLKNLLVGLADESVPVALISPPGGEADSIIPPAVEVIRHPALDVPFLERYNRRLLLNRLDKFQPDVLHCLCETSAALARWLARHLDVPYLLNINSIATHWHLITLSTIRCANIIVPAKTIADHFAAAHPKFADRVHQINAGSFVDDSTACFAHPDRLTGIVVAPPPDNPGDLGALFHTFHRLSVENRQFIVALVSTGQGEKEIRKQLKSLGLSRIVTTVPRLAALYPAFSAADIFIVPRPSFSFNPLMLAAMGAGSAVVAPKGGVDDLVIEGKTATTFDPDDQLSIYNCLRHLFDRPDEARQIAAAAQQYLRQNHHVSDMVGSTLQLYRRARLGEGT